MNRLPTIPICMLGSSITRRTDIGNRAFEMIVDDTDGEFLGMMVDSPPERIPKKAADYMARIGAVMYREYDTVIRMNSDLASDSKLDAGFIITVDGGHSLFVNMLIEATKQQTNMSKPIVGPNGQPILTAEMKEIGEMNAAIVMSRPLLVDGYAGFYWGGTFLVASDEEDAETTTRVAGKAPDGSMVTEQIPIGSDEQMRHFWFKNMIEGFNIPAVELPVDVEEAARLMANVIVEDILKRGGSDEGPGPKVIVTGIEETGPADNEDSTSGSADSVGAESKESSSSGD